MSRLIDEDALLANKFRNPISYAAFCNLVKRQPTAHPEMRCEDCDSAEPAGKGIYCLTHSVYMRCGDYCSYWQKEEAERREDGQTD